MGRQASACVQAVYAASCLWAVEEAMAGSRRSMMDLLSRMRVRYVPEDEISSLGVPSSAYVSVNAERDLLQAWAISVLEHEGRT